MGKTLLMPTEKNSIVSSVTRLGGHSTCGKIVLRGIATLVSVVIFIFLSFASLVGAKETGATKGLETQKDKMQQSQLATPQKSKPGEKEGRLKEPGPLTEEEQREFEKFGGDWETPNVFKNEKEAIKYLKILLKGNEKTIRWYQKLGMAGKNKEEDEKWKKWKYGDNIATALNAINIGTDKEGYKLAVEVLKTKRDYPEALAEAAKEVKFAHDPNVIPTLKEIANYPVPWVRLEVAGSLLSLGDAETALPVLDKLAEKEGYVQALYYLFSAPGKIIDERGYSIFGKALNNPRAEIKISATKLLLESKKIQKNRAEEIALTILNNFRGMEEYGVRRDPKTYQVVAIPGSGITDVEAADKKRGSDFRACEAAIFMLIELKSKKAIPSLEKISQNPGASYLSRNAKEAIKTLEK